LAILQTWEQVQARALGLEQEHGLEQEQVLELVQGLDLLFCKVGKAQTWI